MAYTVINFKTKKALKEAVAAWTEYQKNPALWKLRNGTLDAPEPVQCYQPGLGPPLARYTGTISLEGPHYPQPHRWYASARLVDGIVVSVG